MVWLLIIDLQFDLLFENDVMYFDLCFVILMEVSVEWITGCIFELVELGYIEIEVVVSVQ